MPDNNYDNINQPPYEQPPQNRPPYEQPPYGQPPQNRPPYEQPPYGQPPQNRPPYEQPPYGQPPQNRPPAEKNPMATASLIIGILALISCCIPLVQFPMGVVGLLLAIFSKKGRPFHGAALAGLVFSILAIVVSIVMVAYIYIIGVLVRTDPNFAAMYNEIYNTMMEQYQNFFQSAPTN